MSTDELTDQTPVPTTPAVPVETVADAPAEKPARKPAARKKAAASSGDNGAEAVVPAESGPAPAAEPAAPSAPAVPVVETVAPAAETAAPAPVSPAPPAFAPGPADGPGDGATSSAQSFTAAPAQDAPAAPAAVDGDGQAPSGDGQAPAADGDGAGRYDQQRQQGQGGQQQRQGKGKNRRGRDKQRQGGGGGEQVRDDRPSIPCQGILDVLPDGFGFLRTSGFTQGDRDVYVSLSQIRRFGLRRGDLIDGQVREPKDNEKYNALLKIDLVNGIDPETARKRPIFEQLTPLFPEERLRLETDEHDTAARIMDLLCPIG